MRKGTGGVQASDQAEKVDGRRVVKAGAYSCQDLQISSDRYNGKQKVWRQKFSILTVFQSAKANINMGGNVGHSVKGPQTVSSRDGIVAWTHKKAVKAKLD